MIFHASVAALNPREVAGFFASLWQGRVYPFHPVDNAFIVLAGDKDGSAIEVYPKGTVNRFGELSVEFHNSEKLPVETATHLAVATQHDQVHVEDLARKFGWKARLCDRGPFQLIEVWVEDKLLVEVFTPELQIGYREAMTFDNWEQWS